MNPARHLKPPLKGRIRPVFGNWRAVPIADGIRHGEMQGSHHIVDLASRALRIATVVVSRAGFPPLEIKMRRYA